MSKITVQFPADCYIRPRAARDAQGNIVHDEHGKPVMKRGYYRGIVVSGEDEFLEHYVDRNGNPINQPSDGTTVYYSLNAPNVDRYEKGLPVYQPMELEAWSSTNPDGSERRGVKVVDGRNTLEAAVEAANMISESLTGHAAEIAKTIYEQELAVEIRRNMSAAIAAARNRQGGSAAKTETQKPDPQTVSAEEDNDDPFKE
jgi:hypothetical protein